jgi:hypothetical protein
MDAFSCKESAVAASGRRLPDARALEDKQTQFLS